MTETSAVPKGIATIVNLADTGTDLVLIRHGEAVCNVEGILGGIKGCRGLTERGRGQADLLCQRLAATGELAGTSGLYTSILPRAIETATIIKSGLERHDGPLELVTDCDLCELHPGEADGLAWAEFAERFGDPDYAARPDEPIAPGGESWFGFTQRVVAALGRIVERHLGGRAVVVCHGGVIEVAMVTLLPSVEHRLWLGTEHTSMTWWRLGQEITQLQRFNDAAHLLPGAFAQQA